MKKSLAVLAGLFLWSCGPQKSQESQGDKPSESVKAKEDIVQSPFPTIAVGKGPDALFLTPNGKFLYVANVEDSFISVIDTKTDEVIQAIDGIRYPWGFTRLGNSSLVAVSGWDKQVVVIDFNNHEIIKEQLFESNLGGITSSENGKTIYVISVSDKRVLQLDDNLAVIDQFETGNGPDGIGNSKDGTKLYVTNTEDGTISIINVVSKKTSVITKGGKPELIHSSEDNSILLISNFSNNEAYILDTESDEIIQTISSLNGPEEIVMSDDGELIYIVNFKNRKVYVFETTNYTKQDKEYIVGKDPIGFVRVGSKKAYVSNYGDNNVSVIQLNNN